MGRLVNKILIALFNLRVGPLTALFLAVSCSRLQMVEATTDREEVRLSVSRSLCPEAGLGCRDSCMAGPRLGVSTRDTNGIYRQTAGTPAWSRWRG